MCATLSVKKKCINVNKTLVLLINTEFMCAKSVIHQNSQID